MANNNFREEEEKVEQENIEVQDEVQEDKCADESNLGEPKFTDSHASQADTKVINEDDSKLEEKEADNLEEVVEEEVGDFADEIKKLKAENKSLKAEADSRKDDFDRLRDDVDTIKYGMLGLGIAVAGVVGFSLLKKIVADK